MKIINIIMFSLMVLVNYLANALPINGKTTGELSAQYPNLFVPAGVTFSIWGVIYILLLVFVVIQFLEINKSLVKLIGWAFALSCLFNALWIIAWHYEHMIVSLLIMIGLLVTLIIINYKISSYPFGITKASFGIYLGWICIATIANVTALLVKYNWDGWGVSPEIWTIVMIGVGVAITSLSIIRMHNPFIGIAVVWAFIGIVIKRQADYASIVIAAIAGIIILVPLTVWIFTKGYTVDI